MPRWPTRASGIRPRKPSTIPSPARRIAITTMSSPRRWPRVVSSGVSTSISASRRSRSASKPSSIAASRRRRRNSPDGVVAVAQHAEVAGDERVVDDGHSGGHARARYSLGAVSGPRRNVELKAVDPDPRARWRSRSALGASDEGVLVQRDTYFRVAVGAAEAARGGAGRGAPDRLLAARRRRRPRLVLPRAARGRRHARRAQRRRSASTSWSRSAGTCCCGRPCGSTSTRSTGLGSFIELEAVAEPESDLYRERAPGRPSDRRAVHRRAAARAPTPTCSGPRRSPTPSCCSWRARRRRGRTRRTRTSRSAPPCAPRTAAATRARTSRTPRTRRASARRRPRSARWWPAGAGGSSRWSWRRRARRSARRAAAAASGCASSRAPTRRSTSPTSSGSAARRSLAELLPLSFGPESLG